MSSITEFGSRYLLTTGLTAGMCAAEGAFLGSITSMGAAIGASIGAGIGAIECFISFPVQYAAKSLTTRSPINIDKNNQPIRRKIEFKSPAHMVLYHTATAINSLVVKGVVWGGAAFLGIVSLPAAAVIGGGLGLYLVASKLEDVVLNLSPKSLHPVAAMATLALKVAVIAGVFIAAIQLGLLAPPWAIALGISTAVLALMGTGFQFIYIYSDEIRAYGKSLEPAT